MSDQEVNIELALFEEWDANPMYFDKPDYTTDWNDFHRVWMKFNTSDYADIQNIQQLITHNATPLQAAHQLAEIIKKEKR